MTLIINEDGKKQHIIRKMQAQHILLLGEYMLHPEKSNKELATYLGMTHSWVTRVKRSPVFLEAVERIALEIQTDRQRSDTQLKLRALVICSIDKLMHRLDGSDARTALSAMRYASKLMRQFKS